MPSSEQPGRPGGRVFPGSPAPASSGNQISGVPEQVAGASDQESVAARLQDIDDALAHLAELPVDAQVAVFTDLHQRLTAALAVTATATGPADEQSARRPGPAQPSR